MRNTRHSFHSGFSYRRAVRGGKNRDENVVPMINVIFLLLLYFMVAGNLDPDFDIILPEATRNPDTRLYTLAVFVARNGDIWFESRIIETDDLRTELAGNSGIGKLKIHADANVDALVISYIMNVAAKVGISRFFLVTQSRIDVP